MPMFGSESDVMRSGAPASVNGLPVAAPGDQMTPQQPPAPQGPVNPGPTEMALANQLYQTQQMVLQLQQEMADMRRRRVAMQFDFIRDNDGRLAGMTATEGSGQAFNQALE